MYWSLFKCFALVVAPVPINPAITRPDPLKNEWMFSCTEWLPVYKLMYEYCKDTLAQWRLNAENLSKSE